MGDEPVGSFCVDIVRGGGTSFAEYIGDYAFTLELGMDSKNKMKYEELFFE